MIYYMAFSNDEGWAYELRPKNEKFWSSVRLFSQMVDRQPHYLLKNASKSLLSHRTLSLLTIQRKLGDQSF